MTKMGFVAPKGRHRMSIYYDEKEKYNHYKVYMEWQDSKRHKRLVEKYADLYSAVLRIASYTNATKFMDDPQMMKRLEELL